jgi:indole-3-glycerol phosphate synthase
MAKTFLHKILSAKRERVEAAKRAAPPEQVRDLAAQVRSTAEKFRLSSALRNSNGINIIAEIKRASPSKGAINPDIDVDETAIAYKAGGACAISVLTEEDFFQGSLDHLCMVRRAVDLPVLRKDFIFDEYQIHEAAAAGADAVLLIVAALPADQLERLHSSGRSLGLDVLIEVHDLDELQTAQKIGAHLVGVNNRNLHKFDVSLNVSRELIGHSTNGSLMIAESGLSDASELRELRSLGFDGFLIGETLMRSSSPEAELRTLITV